MEKEQLEIAVNEIMGGASFYSVSKKTGINKSLLYRSAIKKRLPVAREMLERGEDIKAVAEKLHMQPENLSVLLGITKKEKKTGDKVTDNILADLAGVEVFQPIKLTVGNFDILITARGQDEKN